MTPDQLCAKNTESGHQKALFAWAAMARIWGFDVANDMEAYTTRGALQRTYTGIDVVPELEWLHAIPNGGARDAVTAARMKAEGARAGVYDIFLPVPRCGFHGMYVEMKKPAGGRESAEQIEFGEFIAKQGYYGVLCRSWRAAAEQIEAYLLHRGDQLLRDEVQRKNPWGPQ